MNFVERTSLGCRIRCRSGFSFHPSELQPKSAISSITNDKYRFLVLYTHFKAACVMVFRSGQEAPDEAVEFVLTFDRHEVDELSPLISSKLSEQQGHPF